MVSEVLKVLEKKNEGKLHCERKRSRLEEKKNKNEGEEGLNYMISEKR